MDDDDLNRFEAVMQRQASAIEAVKNFAREGAELQRLADAGQFSVQRYRALRQRSVELQAELASILNELELIEGRHDD